MSAPAARDSLFAPLGPAPLSDKDFGQLRDIIESTLGIKMPLSKKTMIQSRLLRRLRVLGLQSYKDYCQYLSTPKGLDAEMVHFLDLATTNKTSFFREDEHFSFLVREALPTLLQRREVATRRAFRLWSAGCSTGEEPYTLAMVLSEFVSHPPAQGWDFSINASDVSTRVLDRATKAVYAEADIEPIPQELRRKYLLRSKDREEKLVRFAPEIRNRVRFRRLNFMDTDYRVQEPVEIIFFRNVIIYFDRVKQTEIINKLCRSLVPGGYLFVSLSETLHGLDVPLNLVGRSVYVRV